MHLIRLPNGQVINSGRQEFDTDTLEEIARIGSGSFYKAEDLSTLSQIFKTIDELEKTEIQHRKIVETEDKFYWFLLIAALFCSGHLLWKQTLGRTAPAVA
jgi:Ca-activated chloride channel family protein